MDQSLKLKLHSGISGGVIRAPPNFSQILKNEQTGLKISRIDRPVSVEES